MQEIFIYFLDVAPPVQCWADKNLMSGCETPTLKWVRGGRMGKMYQEMVYYNRMHVKTRLSQSILSKIVGLIPS
jgi:uncharacterized protein YfaP (DUF2135 family)